MQGERVLRRARRWRTGGRAELCTAARDDGASVPMELRTMLATSVGERVSAIFCPVVSVARTMVRATFVKFVK